jgi:RecA/RadA recombinase
MAETKEKKAAAKKTVAVKKEKVKHPRDWTAAERREALLKARGELDDDYKVLKSDDVEELVPYGMLVYDHVLRLRGMGFRGRVTQVHGKDGTAKSTSIYKMLCNFQRFTKEPVSVYDFERTGTINYLREMGVDVSPNMLFFKQPDSVEDCQQDMIRLMTAGVRLFVCDSIPRMKSKVAMSDILSGKAFKADMAVHPRVMTKFYDNMLPHLAEFNCLLMITNQIRDRIEDGNDAKNAQKYPTFANMPYTLPGGWICRFTPAIMIENVKVMKSFKPGPVDLYGSGTKDDFILEPATPETKDLEVVQRMRVRTLKNKVGGGGYRQGFIWIRPTGVGKIPGQDENLSIRELARQYGLIDYSPRKLWYVGTSVDDAIATYKSKEEAIQDLVIDENPEVLSKLSVLVGEAIDNDQSTRFVSEAPSGEERAYLDGDESTKGFDEAEESLTISKAFEIEE